MNNYVDKIRAAFSVFAEAVKGSEADYTAIPIKRAVVLLAIPMVIEMSMESLFAVVDIFFVAKLGDEAVATVGLTESMLSIVYSLGFGVAMGATAMVSRRIGEKDIEAAKKVAAQTLSLGILMAFFISLIGINYSKDLLKLMGGSEHLAETGSVYTAWMFGGNYVILLLFLLNGIFRGAGNAAIAMRTLWISNGINLVLDPMLIMGYGPFPECGLAGAAYATNIGRGVGVAYQLYVLFSAVGIIQLKLSDLKPKWNILSGLLKISAGGTGQFIISSASWIFLTRIMARFGSEALAGYTIGIRVLIFTILPAWGLANAAATLVGQNLGAKEPERAEKSVWISSLYNMIFLGFVSVIYFFFSREIVMFFSMDEEIVAIGAECLRYLALGYLFFAFGMVMVQAFNGAGDTKTPTILNFIFFWLIQIPLAWILAVTLDYGPKGIFLAIIISEAMQALAAVYLFKKGKWKLKQV